jgi:hypothetical protein
MEEAAEAEPRPGPNLNLPTGPWCTRTKQLGLEHFVVGRALRAARRARSARGGTRGVGLDSKVFDVEIPPDQLPCHL